MFFLFIYKTLPVNNLKTGTAMNAKISAFVICVGEIVFCYYMICITVLLILSKHENISEDKRERAWEYVIIFRKKGVYTWACY